MEPIFENIDVFGVKIGIPVNTYLVGIDNDNSRDDSTIGFYKVYQSGFHFNEKQNPTVYAYIKIPGKTKEEIINEFNKKLSELLIKKNRLFNKHYSKSFNTSDIDWNNIDNNSVITYRQFLKFTTINSRFIEELYISARTKRTQCSIQLFKDSNVDDLRKSFNIALNDEELNYYNNYITQYDKIKNEFGELSAEMCNFQLSTKNVDDYFKNKYLNENE